MLADCPSNFGIVRNKLRFFVFDTNYAVDSGIFDLSGPLQILHIKSSINTASTAVY